MTPRRSPFRRWIAPLAILAVAAGLGWWGSREQAQRSEDVQGFVNRLLAAEAQRPPVTGPGSIDLRTPELTARLEVLRAARARVETSVRPGDIDGLGDGRATHTVVLSLDGTPRLGLRLLHHGGSSELSISVIGYWIP
ncbi:MAG: hypothetical protein ACYTGC_00440 [Planctomycetota bacterium]|jgi:hypothetical protein